MHSTRDLSTRDLSLSQFWLANMYVGSFLRGGGGSKELLKAADQRAILLPCDFCINAKT